MKKILIISLNAIGDVYLSKSAVPYLKEKFDEIEISFLVNRASVFLFPESKTGVYFSDKSFFGILSSFQKLKNKEFDYIFSFFPGVVNTFFFLALRAKFKGGFISIVKRKYWHNRNLTGLVKSGKKYFKIRWEKTQHYMDLIGKVLTALKITDAGVIKKIIPFEVKRQWNGVVLHPFSRYQERCLTLAQIFEIRRIIKKQFSEEPVIIGDEKVKPLESFGFKVKIKPSLRELTLLVNSGLFISVDSFPLHLADAYNSNFLGLFNVSLPRNVLFNFAKSIYFGHRRFDKIPLKLFASKIEEYLMKSANFRN